ncbi:MAG TPA: hypothetical protein DEO70_05795 [Bacteroidales bacterium]|nr:MAG: hypothetical protein CVU06_03870 [Bacteroidetes bacterium HGW-Bacteroidetes-22]HBZ66333.1 hypothetical protein [Bacteroidales bacterium]
MMLTNAIASYIATLCFAVIFNIRGNNKYWAAGGGMIAWVTYQLALSAGISQVYSLLPASVLFSAYSEIVARQLRTPVTTLIICALIPLVPGAGMYNTMFAVVQGSTTEAIELGLKTLGQAGTLAAGVAFVSTIANLITRVRRRLPL